jgi:hypothetical protein
MGLEDWETKKIKKKNQGKRKQEDKGIFEKINA